MKYNIQRFVDGSVLVSLSHKDERLVLTIRAIDKNDFWHRACERVNIFRKLNNAGIMTDEHFFEIQDSLIAANKAI